MRLFSKKNHLPICAVLIFLLMACEKDSPKPKDENGFFDEYTSRHFKMGFTSWSFGPNPQDVSDTYSFLATNSDIYAEHIDASIPWQAWMNDEPLPEAFTSEIAYRVSNKVAGSHLLLSVSLLNGLRKDLATDFDGNIPNYTAFDDQPIEDAYVKHLEYLLGQFDPDYLVMAIEANELAFHSMEKWEGYKRLIKKVEARIRTNHPNLKISESMTLHNIQLPDVNDPEQYRLEMIEYMNQLEFVTISHYPFFKQHNSQTDFQSSLDFLHQNVNKPIAFVETAHIAEDLVVDNFGLNIKGNSEEQNVYLQTLLTNAQENQYEFIIWWAHRDFDALWETFPEESKDLGRIWRDTGLSDENGARRPALDSWEGAFAK